MLKTYDQNQVQKEFAKFCEKLPRTVCANHGHTDVVPIAKTNNCYCKTCRCVTQLAPSLEVIYGSKGNNVYYNGGTGEMENGELSASGKRWELHRKCPQGNRQGGPPVPGIREVRLVLNSRRGPRSTGWLRSVQNGA